MSTPLCTSISKADAVLEVSIADSSKFQNTTWYGCSVSLKNMNPIGLIQNL